MHKRMLVLLLTTLATTSAVVADEESEPSGSDVEKQVASLIEKQNELADRYNTILRKLKQHDDLVAIDKTITDAKKRLAQAEADNDALTDARVAEQAAREAVKTAVEEKLAEHPEGRQLLEQLEQLHQKRADSLWEIELAEFQLTHPLSPVNRALADDPDLSAAKAKLDVANIEDRSDAKAVYDALRADKLDDLVEAQRHLAAIEDGTSASQRLQESIVAVEERLSPIRKQIERVESKRVEDAREKVAAALNSDAIVALRKEVNDAVTQYNERITKLVAENEEAVRLKEEYDGVVAKIKELRAVP